MTISHLTFHLEIKLTDKHKNMESFQNVSLTPYNTFQIDVKAENLVIFKTADEASVYFNEHQNIETPYLVIGEGSNLLFKNDFKGQLFKIENKGFNVIENIGKDVWVRIAAGEKWDDLVAWAVKNGLGGIENLSLIPGMVGAAPVQNIGAYGVEFKDVFNSLEAIEIKNGDKRTFYFRELEFDYRNSIFKNELKNKFIITSVIIKLNKYPKLDLTYGQLKTVAKELSGKNIPDIKDIRRAVIHIRESKLPNHEEIGNAGSFFKNPIISKEKYTELIEIFPKIVSYSLEDGNYKLAAAWLIEHAGLKGFSLGNAATHKDHALIIINKGNATGSEIHNISLHIQEKVKGLFDIQLEPEVLIIS